MPNSFFSLFDRDTIASILLKEFMNMRLLCSKLNIELKITDYNIFKWKLLFKKFKNKELNDSLMKLKDSYNYNYIEIDIIFHPNFVAVQHMLQAWMQE